ncbi:MAG: SDR family NAD(P)-dependent oxidoreductase [Burkholderia sp.]
MTAPLKVFITGASSGLGLALAEAYARQGRHARTGGPPRRQPRRIRAAPSRSPHPADVRDAAALQAAADAFVAAHGWPDVVIANAGISRGAISGEGDLAAFREIMDVNYYGMVQLRALRGGHEGRAARHPGRRGERGRRARPARLGPPTAPPSRRPSSTWKRCASSCGPRGSAWSPSHPVHPYADDRAQPLSDALPNGRGALRRARAARHRGAGRVPRDPLQMGLVAKILHIAPRWLYDRLFEKAPRRHGRRLSDTRSRPARFDGMLGSVYIR